MPLTELNPEFLDTPMAGVPDVVASSRWDVHRFVQALPLYVALGTFAISLAVMDGVALICSGTALAIALVTEAIVPR